MSIIQNLQDKIKETETRIHFLEIKLRDMKDMLYDEQKEENEKRRLRRLKIKLNQRRYTK